ncbi:MAG: hypothetical protein DLM72_14970 [Candidatus Nitrosopolaris wilkensis]|nr:MAG: hypothetical protein DLM72_14970 [Candidatus Nitrosopolaris wilkensis]
MHEFIIIEHGQCCTCLILNKQRKLNQNRQLYRNMVIKTKSIYEPSEENDDGIRVLITRFYPRGIKKNKFDCWIRELSPSGDSLNNYRQGKYNWEEFKIAFLSEMRNNRASLERIHALNVQNQSTVITLLCYEREGEHCHRQIVRDTIEKPQIL